MTRHTSPVSTMSTTSITRVWPRPRRATGGPQRQAIATLYRAGSRGVCTFTIGWTTRSPRPCSRRSVRPPSCISPRSSSAGTSSWTADVELQTQLERHPRPGLRTVAAAMITGLLRMILSRDTVHMSLSSKQRVFAARGFSTACTSCGRPAGSLTQAVCAYDRCTELFHALRDGLDAMFPSLRVASHVVATTPTYFSARLPAQIPEALDHRGWPLVALPVARRSAAEPMAVIGRVRDKVENAKPGTAGSWARRGQLLVAADIDLLHVVGLTSRGCRSVVRSYNALLDLMMLFYLLCNFYL